MKKINTYISLLALLVLIISYSCNSDGGTSFQNSEGKGGSLARFTTVGNYLYTVDNTELHVFNISNNEAPVLVNTISVGFGIETLYSLRNNLYIGSTNGMFIYSIANKEEPTLLSEVQHFTACDPVIANLTHAFVTLKGGRGCGGNLNMLQIYDIADLQNPVLISQRQLISPVGIALYQDYLFVCDDKVKIFDISNINQIELITTIPKNTFDVIINSNHLVLVGEDGIYQYQLDPASIENIQELSIITL